MWKSKVFRDAFFITTGTGVLVDQVFIDKSAQAILIFLGIYLLGCAPALHVDEAGSSPWVRLVLSMMGANPNERAKGRKR